MEVFIALNSSLGKCAKKTFCHKNWIVLDEGECEGNVI